MKILLYFLYFIEKKIINVIIIIELLKEDSVNYW